MNLKELALELYYETTNNFNEAIFLDEKCNMLWGEFDCNIRGLDHQCLLDYSNFNMSQYERWEQLHSQNIIRLVPETKTALVMNCQTINKKQLDLINQNNYTLELY